ncbi:MAG: D-glycero-beta-D-manno-heptose 1-phosphate adenylyltransferase [Crocinitomicaceae bacterium]|nr:D-glycero-beta-D-manno-heptose 1-phosphate adenylyltransferase [Crocinitomicaceae bacterium]
MPGIFIITSLNEEISQWRKAGDKIVFTNGVFDILHIGHVNYLEEAKKAGDRLIVGINSDASVKRLGKGPDRPVNPEQARARIIASLRCVDAVIIFDDNTPYELILRIQPEVLVKGGDYDPLETDSFSKRYIVGSAEVIARGGVVLAIPLVEGFSTTGIIERLKKK